MRQKKKHGARYGQGCSDDAKDDHDQEDRHTRVGDEAQDRGQEHYTAHTHRPPEEVRDGQEAGTRQGERLQGQACGSQAHHSAQADNRPPG